MKVLIVEDSSFTRGLIRMDLADDYEVIETDNGLQGLVQLVEAQPDLVLVDLLMPWLDGFEFIKRVRETGYEGPVIVCSANTQPSIEARVRELGGTAFMAKPELLVPGRARKLVEEFLGPARSPGAD